MRSLEIDPVILWRGHTYISFYCWLLSWGLPNSRFPFPCSPANYCIVFKHLVSGLVVVMQGGVMQSIYRYGKTIQYFPNCLNPPPPLYFKQSQSTLTRKSTQFAKIEEEKKSIKCFIVGLWKCIRPLNTELYSYTFKKPKVVQILKKYIQIC